jgi:hypothetical protein
MPSDEIIISESGTPVNTQSRAGWGCCKVGHPEHQRSNSATAIQRMPMRVGGKLQEEWTLCSSPCLPCIPAPLIEDVGETGRLLSWDPGQQAIRMEDAAPESWVRPLFTDSVAQVATFVPPRDLERTPCRHPCGTRMLQEEPYCLSRRLKVATTSRRISRLCHLLSVWPRDLSQLHH